MNWLICLMIVPSVKRIRFNGFNREPNYFSFDNSKDINRFSYKIFGTLYTNLWRKGSIEIPVFFLFVVHFGGCFYYELLQFITFKRPTLKNFARDERMYMLSSSLQRGKSVLIMFDICMYFIYLQILHKHTTQNDSTKWVLI